MKKEKTLHELAQEFPEKTYSELEKYRDADRQEEAKKIPLTESQQKQEELEPIGMGHNHPPDEGEEQDNPTLWEIAAEHNVTYADAVPIQEDMRLKRDALKAACIIGEARKHRTPLERMKKRAEEAEGELSIMKGIETNRVKEAQDALANALEVNESHQKLNGKLQERLTELDEENKKMHDILEKKMQDARKAGL
jgi:hypothetical protein